MRDTLLHVRGIGIGVFTLANCIAKVAADAADEEDSRRVIAIHHQSAQAADEVGDPGALVDPKQRSGALYPHTAVAKPLANPPGEWREGRILVYPDHVEHGLSGQWAARHPVEVPLAGAIALQHDSTEVRFSKIRIRQLGADLAER